MNRVTFSLYLAAFLAFILVLPVRAASAPTPTPAPIAILSPKSGEAVQGLVRVVGNTDVPGFKAAYLFFGYAQDPTHTWFLLAKRDAPTWQGLLARWNTSLITDGDYVLRLVVKTADGRVYETKVPVRVRNYTPIETPTPAPTTKSGATATPPLPTATASPLYPTPTPLPPNPGTLTVRQIGRAAGYGILLASALLLAFLLTQRR